MANKIKEEQLKELKEKVSGIQQLQSQVGNLEAQKHIVLHQLLGIQDSLQKLQVELEQEYGKVSINIEDGSYQEIKDEA